MGAIDVKYMSEVQKNMLRDYQQKVYEKLSPYLTSEEAEWLRRETEV